MSEQTTVDVIDSVLGLEAGSELKALREKREKLKALTQSSYLAALRPKEPRNFPYALRAAIAARMSALWKADELAAHYRGLLEQEGSTAELLNVADSGWAPEDGQSRLAAILRHVDLVTLTPKAATRANIEALHAAGLDDRDIVTLAGLIAFVNYQILVVAGLKMLRDN